MRRRFVLAFSLPACLWLVGCGGGGGGGENGKVVPQAAIRWSPRSRATAAPGSALSVRLRIQPVGGASQDLRANRQAAPDAYTGVLTGSDKVAPGPADVTATFYAQADQAGDVVAQGSARVAIAADGTIPDIATTGRVAAVDVGAGQQVPVAASQDLTFAARTSDGALLVLTPGAAFWNVATGSDRLTFVDAGARGLLPGTATVRATVDGVTSAAVSVKVTSAAVVSVTPPAPTVSVGKGQSFSAGVTGTNGGTQAVTWSVREGASGGSITAGGAYTAPAIPGTYHVVATSVYDPDKSLAVTVTVVAGNVGIGID